MNFNKNNFSLGEVSPSIFFRTDLQNHQNGLLKANNCLINTTGSIESFPELKIINSLNYNNKKEIKVYEYIIDEKDITYSINYDIKNIILIFSDKKIDYAYLKSDGSIYKVGYIDTTILESDVNKISIAQVDNLIIICSKKTKPIALRFKELDNSNKFTFDSVDYWGSITDGPIKNIGPEYTREITNTNICSWRRANGTTKEPEHGDIILPEGYYLKIKEEGGAVFTEAFLKKILGGRVDILGNQFKVKGYTTSEGLSGAINGSTAPTKLTGYTLISILPLVLVSSSLVPTFKNKVDANGNYVFVSGTSTIAREPDWELFDLNTLFYFQDIFRDNKYPEIVNYFKGRIVFSKIDENSEFVCFSQVNNYFNFTGDVKNDDSGFTQTVPSNKKVNIIDIVVNNSLIIFTNEGVWSTPLGDTITPLSSFFIKHQLPIPNPKNFWVNSRGVTYYIDFTNKLIMIKISELGTYYVYEEVTVYNDVILKGEIKGMQEFIYNGEYFIMINTGEYIALCKINVSQNAFSFNRIIRDTYKDFFIVNNSTYPVLLEFDTISQNLNSMLCDKDNYMELELDIYPGSILVARKDNKEHYNLVEYELNEAQINVIGEGRFYAASEYIDNPIDELTTLIFPSLICGKIDNKFEPLNIKKIGKNKTIIYNIGYNIKINE